MKIDVSKFGGEHVLELLGTSGHQALYVGGCVRNAILGAEISDIDIASSAHPQEVLNIAQNAGLRAIATGLDHGTITVVADATVLEITTFRQDIKTDGRHAEVAFGTDITADARRRDFTMNALYADKNGAVIDPLGGLTDVLNRHVRFIDDPAKRIAEDALRILRFFRFFACYGDPEGGLDAEGLAACATASDALEMLSKERIGHEMRKLFTALDPTMAVAAMAQSGILAAILPGADARFLGPLIEIEHQSGHKLSWAERISILGAQDIKAHLRLSNDEEQVIAKIQSGLTGMAPPQELAYRYGPRTAWACALIRAATSDGHLDQDLAVAIESGAESVFPVKSSDLPETGPALGARLRELEEAWIASGFAKSKEALLS